MILTLRDLRVIRTALRRYADQIKHDNKLRDEARELRDVISNKITELESD